MSIAVSRGREGDEGWGDDVTNSLPAEWVADFSGEGVELMASTRFVSTVAVIDGIDDETFEPNERGVGVRLDRTILSDSQRKSLAILPVKWGGECRVELSVGLRRLDNDTVHVDVLAKLFEGTSEDTSDLDGQKSFGFDVLKGTTERREERVDNVQEGGDFAKITMVVTNSLFQG